jgi:Family of unknown function (DUF6279)
MRYRFLWLPLVVSCLIATGCSIASLGYSALPSYALWSLDRYFSFDDTQRNQVRLALNELQDWHRSQELGEYKKLMVSAQQRLKNNVKPQDLSWVRDESNKRWTVTVDRIVQPMAQVALTLKPEQIERAKQRIAQTNKESRAKYLQTDLKEREQERYKRNAERFEDFFGSLDDAQKTQLQSLMNDAPKQDEIWFEERVARQKLFIELLTKIRTEQPSTPVAATWLRNYMSGLTSTADPSRQAYFDSLIKASDNTTLTMLAMMSAEQKNNLNQKIGGYIKEIDKLIR